MKALSSDKNCGRSLVIDKNSVSNLCKPINCHHKRSKLLAIAIQLAKFSFNSPLSWTEKKFIKIDR